MSEITAKAGFGGGNALALFSLNATATGVTTPAMITLDRIVSNGPPVGVPLKKNVVFAFDNRQADAPLEAIFNDGFLTNEEPVIVVTQYENRDKTTSTLVGSSAKPFIAIYYGATNADNDVQVWTIHGVFSGTAGDLTNTGAEEMNGIDVTITGIITALTITVDATAYDESIVETGAAVVISAGEIGQRIYQSAA